MAVWTNQIQEFHNVAYPENIAANFQIRSYVPGARAALSADGELIATGIADSAGNVTLQVDSTFNSSILKLTILNKLLHLT